ncbi:MAG TPA: hypothetical protein VG347_01015 [Verrucomicrobiae bacterium]|nr:hypothetical protein [Verrucomicrobiae bacterium]
MSDIQFFKNSSQQNDFAGADLNLEDGCFSGTWMLALGACLVASSAKYDANDGIGVVNAGRWRKTVCRITA